MRGPENLLHFAPLLAALSWSVFADMRVRKIPNILTVPLAIAGVTTSFMSGHVVTPTQSLLGLMLGFAIPLVPFVLGAIGGGDVKLMAAIGAWMGPMGVFMTYVVAAVVGMVIVLVQATAQGKLFALFRNSAVVAVNLAHLRELGVDNAKTVGHSCRSISKPLQYAVPLLISVVMLLLWPWLMGAA